MKTLKELLEILDKRNPRSAWDKGVNNYAYGLVEEMIENYGENHEIYGSPSDKKDFLNGADDWHEYSAGGCALIYDYDIAKALCSPSEFKKTKEGKYNPNKYETWIDVQTRALNQAYRRIEILARLS